MDGSASLSPIPVSHSWVGGAPLEGRGGRRSAVSPATQAAFAEFTTADVVQAAQIAETAERAFPAWRDTAIAERCRILCAAHDVLLEEADRIAELIATEQGKPVAEALLVEVLPALEHLRSVAETAPVHLAPRVVEPSVFLIAHKQARLEYVPLGPVLVIAPWNYPFVIPLTGVIAALAAGNTVVLKPALASALVGLSLADLFRRAGLPAGVLNVALVEDDVASKMVADPRFRKIHFTGSVPTGRRVMASAATQGTPVTLELGGKDPAIVCRDADLDRAAEGIVWAAFANAGQTCASVERVYAEEPVADAFVSKVVARVRALKVGDPLDPATDVGPLALARQRSIVEAHVKDAVERGAKVECGGAALDGPGNFFAPTVLTNVDHSMACMRDETFGPTLPIMRVKSVDEAIALANDSPYGLTASGWTKSDATADRLERGLHAGVVTINDHLYTFGEPTSPWGGVKASGMGRTHGEHGLRDFTEPKYVARDLSRGGEVWWFPYGKDFRSMMSSGLRAFHHPSLATRLWSLARLSFTSRYLRRGRFFRVLPNLDKLF